MSLRILVFAAIFSPTAALAASFGTPGGCAYLGVGNLDANLEDDGSPAFYDGTEIGGQDWSCTVSTGKCDSDGGEWAAKVNAKVAAETAVITIDGQSFTLPRCD